MAAIQPYRGASTQHFYALEDEQGVTPITPVWHPLRFTSGNPSVARDSIVSAELDGSREISSIRVGNEQVNGEFAIELSQSSQDDLLACAMTSSWVAGIAETGLSVTVAATAKTFSRAAGDFTTNVKVGDLVYFAGLTGDNAKPFMVTTVTPLVITGAGIQHKLTDEAAVTTDFKSGDKLQTGNLCKSMSIFTYHRGKCGTPDSYVMTRGVEITGFTIEQAVNAMITGSFPFIGLTQEIVLAPPSGLENAITFDADPFASVDVSAFDGSAPLRLIDSFTITNENETSSQFELGNRAVAFVERGRANNTFSLAGKLYDMTMVNKFLNEVDIELTSILSNVAGAMSFTLHAAKLTEATREVGGPESVVLNMAGQATGTPDKSSITIQRLTYA